MRVAFDLNVLGVVGRLLISPVMEECLGIRKNFFCSLPMRV